MLEVNNLKVHYGEIRAVRGINFATDKGEVVTLIGSNGAGKTSTLRSISGITPKAGGRVKLLEEDITGLPPQNIVKKGVSQVPEGRRIFSNLSVEENLFMGAYTENYSDREYSENVQRVFNLFPRLEERREQDGKNLSGGEQQMLAMGRAIMLDPKIMMLDEPSLGLAPMLVETIFDLITEINESMGTTFLLVEQNAKKALEVANRGYVLELGKINYQGNTEDLLDNPKVEEAYLGIG